MNKQQKQIALIGGGIVVLILIYRWYSSQSGGGTSSPTTGTDTSGAADYAAEAGQEQSDVAGLQSQNSQLNAQEQSDVAAINQSLTGLTTQEQSDVGTLASQEQADTGSLADTLNSTVDALNSIASNQTVDETTLATMGTDVTSLAAGVKQATRTVPIYASNVKKAGTLAHYYKAVTGKNPPRNLSVNNFIYQAWKARIPANRLVTPAKKKAPAPKTTTHKAVAHPNPTHKQQKPKTTKKAAPKPKKPAPKAKAKPSGKRK